MANLLCEWIFPNESTGDQVSDWLRYSTRDGMTDFMWNRISYATLHNKKGERTGNITVQFLNLSPWDTNYLQQ